MNCIAEYLIKFESKQDRRLYCNPCHETLNTRARVGQISNLQTKVKNHFPEHYPPKYKDAQEIDLSPFFGDFSKREKTF